VRSSSLITANQTPAQEIDWGATITAFLTKRDIIFAEVERLEYFGYIRSASLQLGVIRCGTSANETPPV
jgi:hypothetical protein